MTPKCPNCKGRNSHRLASMAARPIVDGGRTTLRVELWYCVKSDLVFNRELDEVCHAREQT